MISVKITEVT